jgi:hypothetical protein
MKRRASASTLLEWNGHVVIRAITPEPFAAHHEGNLGDAARRGETARSPSTGD